MTLLFTATARPAPRRWAAAQRASLPPGGRAQQAQDGQQHSPLSPAASTASFRVDRSGLLLMSDQTVLGQELPAWCRWRPSTPAAAGRGVQAKRVRCSDRSCVRGKRWAVRQPSPSTSRLA